MSKVLRIARPLLLSLLSVIALLCALPTQSVAYTLQAPTDAPPALSAHAALLLEPASGLVLCEKNADEHLPMASTTKIMTALVVLERLDAVRTVTVPQAAVGIEGSSIYLYEGEQITVETLLYALLLSSANDAAAALAIETAGSIESFAELMNQKAKELGLANTHFTNPHGLHDEAHYTTARDLATLTAAALKNERFASIVSTARHTARQDGTEATRLFLNHNRLLRTLPGAVGVKTGFTKAAGRCLVSAATRDGLSLIAVTLRAPNDWKDHEALLEWGFSAYECFSPTPSPVTVPVVGGSKGEVTLLPTGQPTLTLPRLHSEITCTLEAPRFLFGGIEQGQIKGRLVYRMDGEVLCEIPLAANETVEAEQPLGFFARIRQKLNFRK